LKAYIPFWSPLESNMLNSLNLCQSKKCLKQMLQTEVRYKFCTEYVLSVSLTDFKVNKIVFLSSQNPSTIWLIFTISYTGGRGTYYQKDMSACPNICDMWLINIFKRNTEKQKLQWSLCMMWRKKVSKGEIKTRRLYEECYSTQLQTEMSTRNLPGGKGWLVRKAYNPAAICESIIWKMWEPWHFTTQWTTTACSRDSFTFLPLWRMT
jgi:hypothetical protein